MTRINTNVSALTAQNYLNKSNNGLNTTLERLSSGLKINRGADDPAGLIVSEKLRSEMSSLEEAIGNSERASNVIATAEGALAEVAALLITIKGLTVEAANTGALSDEEIRANQLQVDSAIDSITRIANSTTFSGLQLLNGNMGYITSAVSTSSIKSLDVYSALLGNQDYLTVNISGVASAQRGDLRYVTSGVSQSVTLEVASNRGVEVFSFVSGFRSLDMVSAINAVTGATGVSATFINSANPSAGVIFRSVDYGSDAFVSVKALPSSSGTFDVQTASGTATQRDEGSDVVVTVNGKKAVGSGSMITLNSGSLDMRLKLDTQFGAGNSTSFHIAGGGATFQLGPHINSSEQVSIGIGSIAASSLGSIETGYLNEVATGGNSSLVSGNTTAASDIIEEAIDQISVLRGRLGAFEKNTLETNINSLTITLENVTSSESSIRDADYAQESSNMTRNQILVNAGTSVLSIANQTAQSVLSLLQ